jgi:hypothetical protein
MANDTKTDSFSKHVAALLSALPLRQKDIISKRFGLKDGLRKTLEAIGDEYHITRERVRQIENDAKETLTESEHFQRLEGFFTLLEEHFKKYGGMRAEYQLFEEDVKNVLIPTLKTEIAQAYLHLLLSLHDLFIRHPETDEFKTTWALKSADPAPVKQSVKELVQKLEAHREPVSREVLFKWFAGLTTEEQVHVLESYLAISKQIDVNAFGEYGLADWPEISTRGVRDKAYLVLKKHEKPKDRKAKQCAPSWWQYQACLITYTP